MGDRSRGPEGRARLDLGALRTRGISALPWRNLHMCFRRNPDVFEAFTRMNNDPANRNYVAECRCYMFGFAYEEEQGRADRQPPARCAGGIGQVHRFPRATDVAEQSQRYNCNTPALSTPRDGDGQFSHYPAP